MKQSQDDRSREPFARRPGAMNRRGFLATSAGGCIAGAAAWSAGKPARAAQKKSDALHGRITITDIEVHSVAVEYVDWMSYQLSHFYGPWDRRTVYVVHTDNGLIGLGEGSKESEEVIKKYIGSSPFDWIGDEASLGLGTAMYDLMGKSAGIPVYKLFGQKYRSWVPVSSWTVSTHPRRMSEAVKKFSARGFTWMKFHLSPFENIIDQLEAIQAVAPKGFKIHFDFTMGGTSDHMPELLEKMAQFPVTGCFEDPLPPNDIDGYVELRKRVKVPIALHHAPLRATYTVLRRAADVYMLGHSDIGTAMRRSGLFEAAGIPFMLQNAGGHITQAMISHMQAAFKAASFPFICLAECWKSDVVQERRDPTNGFLRVSERPGLGVTLDRSELERLKKLKQPNQEKWILKTRYENGTTMYNIADPKESIFMVRPDVKRLLPPMSYNAPLVTEYWDNDGSADYQAMFKRIEREGLVLSNP
jgi:L-alanine-DL-glutamate epimerase-like enolase superfamily enzyme